MSPVNGIDVEALGQFADGVSEDVAQGNVQFAVKTPALRLGRVSRIFVS